MLFSVVINTFNRPATLARCLDALSRQTGADPLEVIVVNDGGSQPLRAVFEPQWRDRLDLRVLDIPHGGRSAARNRGAAACRGERIFFVGDDVMLQPDCLACHRQCVEEKVAVTGPYFCDGLQGSTPFRYWSEPNRAVRVDDPRNADWGFFLTGNLSLSRKTFLDLGGFDERFKLYGWEDIDLGLRLGRIGGRLVYDQRARGVHEHPPMTRAQIWRREWELGYTSWQFHDKWASVWPEIVRKTLFWDDPAQLISRPAWRRSLGDLIIGLTDRLAPESRLNAALYERLVYAWRFAGAAEARRENPASSPAEGSKP